MAPRTRLTEKLGIRHPVLQSPMGGSAGGSLAAAVSAAGGLGLVVWGGEAIDLIGAVEPAGAILSRIVAQAEAALARRFD